MVWPVNSQAPTVERRFLAGELIELGELSEFKSLIYSISIQADSHCQN